jgi:NAD+ diphosphatase
MFARTHPQGLVGPHPIAIAHHLMRAWLKDG